VSRVRVVVTNVASVDGKLASGPHSVLMWGDPKFCAVTGDANPYPELMRRYQPEAILEGSGSFVRREAGPADLPAPDPRVAGADGHESELLRDFLPGEVLDRAGHRGWFTVVDSRGRVAWTYKEFPDPQWQGWHLLVLVSRATPPAYLGFLRRERIPYLVCGEERVNLHRALERMADELGVQCVVATGGSRLNGALLREGLVDEVDVALYPALIGGETTPSLFGGAPLGEDEWPLRLERAGCEIGPDGSLHLHYRAAGWVTPQEEDGPPERQAEPAAAGSAAGGSPERPGY
jgi:2,5-diamino-6-(ribosylamino)-4(3H)-pyrimidinone 5'-phosphate reductase